MLSFLFGESLPHRACFLSKEWLIAPYFYSNLIIFLCYTVISASLVYVWVKRNDYKYIRGALIYAAFIVLCGVSHLLMSINLFKGWYVAETMVEVVTALVSAVAAGYTMLLIPKLINLPKIDHFGEFVKLSDGLRQRDSDISAIMAMSNDGYWIWNIETGHDFLSESWCDLLGYKQNELSQHVSTWESLMHPDDLPRAKEAMNAHLQSMGETPYYLKARYKHKEGHWVTLEDRGKVTSWNGNSPQRMVGFEKLVCNGK